MRDGELRSCTTTAYNLVPAESFPQLVMRVLVQTCRMFLPSNPIQSNPTQPYNSIPTNSIQYNATGTFCRYLPGVLAIAKLHMGAASACTTVENKQFPSFDLTLTHTAAGAAPAASPRPVPAELPTPPEILDTIRQGKCTFTQTGSSSFLPQDMYNCITCNLINGKVFALYWIGLDLFVRIVVVVAGVLCGVCDEVSCRASAVSSHALQRILL